MIAPLLLLPFLALAQEQAPPEVDQELRARVSGFYQNFLEDSFSPRKAEAFVAEDTKDYFYNALKQKYKSFEILKITYSDHFTKAVVVVSSKMETMMAGQTIVVDFPKDTRWKIENGKWCWTYNPADFPLTPMSTANPPPAPEGAEPKTAGVIPKNSSPAATREAGMAVLKQESMGVDKSNVIFNVGQPSSAQVVFTNGAQGEIEIALDGPVVRGLKTKLDKKLVPANGTAVLTLDYDPSDKSGPKDVWEPKGTIHFRIFVAPFDRMFAVNVQFVDAK